MLFILALENVFVFFFILFIFILICKDELESNKKYTKDLKNIENIYRHRKQMLQEVSNMACKN